MSKIKVGEQYFNWWTTGFVGPFTYKGGDNFAFNSMIRGDIAKLTLAQEGFNYMFDNAWTLDASRDYAGQVHEVFAAEAVDEQIALTNDPHVVEILEALKECTDVLLESLGVTL